MVARIKGDQEDRHRALIMLLKQIKKLSSQDAVLARAHGGIVQGNCRRVKTIEENLPGFGSIISGTVVGELGDPGFSNTT